MNQRILNAMTNQGTVALSGPRGAQHLWCVSGPFVAPSGPIVQFDERKVGFHPPLHNCYVITHKTAPKPFGAVLPSTSHASVAWRVIFVALGILSQCLFSYPLF